ncbi:MAG TPA: single-stranded-DNA-specific exonuclease RecJ [Polyangiaceae bacterium]|nr:single-stranded-DNA-specific exonuclease RecJ [Polyangiaceae bacterium]
MAGGRPPRDPGPPPLAAAALAAKYGLTRTASVVLAGLGVASDGDLEKWLDPKLVDLTPPFAMVDRMAATDRIAHAIKHRHKVAVFGDYDCDGITSAAVMTSLVGALGGDATPLLATRTEGAYGFSAPALARVKASGAKLLVTCDCGSSDHERIESARRAGIDTVVIDHHLVPKDPLPAVAFLNPHRPDCGFGYKHLASCGLALSIGAALRQALGAKLDLRPLLDLVAIGTIADVAPLVGDNRALVRAGLRVLSTGSRVGLRALADLARLDMSHGVTSEDVAFRIAPRLNAPGRLADPDPSLALLLERDPTTAQGIAASIEQIQLQRRALQATMVDEALADLGAMPRGFGVVLARQGWHPGVVGIVAGKVAEQTGEPTIVIGLEGESGRGSVRGPRGFPLYDALTRCDAALVGFGGHQAAAGVHVRADRVEHLRAAWADACATLASGRTFDTGGEPTARLDPDDDPVVVQRDLERFEPYGEGNPAPTLLVEGAVIRAARNIKGHLKLDLDLRGRSASAIAFSMGEAAATAPGRTVSIVGVLRKNTFQGGVELQVSRFWPPLLEGPST